MTQSSRGNGTPLEETFVRATRVKIGGMDLSAVVGGEPGWTTATDLASDGELLDGALLRVGERYGTEERLVSGSLFLKGYLWRILTPAVAAFLIDRRLPDLAADNVVLRLDEDIHACGLTFLDARFAALPTDEAAEHPDATVLPTEDALLAWMRDRLAEEHLPGLFSALRRSRPRRSMRALWWSAVDACAEAFMYVGGELGCRDEAREYAERLLAGSSSLSGPTSYFTLEYDGGSIFTRVRNSCCLYYKLDNGACFTCPRTTHEERLRRLAED